MKVLFAINNESISNAIIKLFEKAAITIISIALISFILPSKLWIGLSLDASSCRMEGS